MVDAAGVVDEHDEALGPCELECQYFDAGQRPLHGRSDLPEQLSLLVVNLGHPFPSHKKWAPRAHFAKPVKMVFARIATVVAMGGPGAPLNRRQLLVRTGVALAAAGFADLDEVAAASEADAALGWGDVRSQFRASRSLIHMGGLYLASHPGPVRRAIERHRAKLDADPVGYLHRQGDRLEADVLRSAGSYLGARPTDIALTDSTTMGLGLLYGGLTLRPGDEVLTTAHDFFATHEALRLATARSGAAVRRVTLYRDAARATEDEIVGSLTRAIGPNTRVVALTWVHSSTGVKLPLRRIVQGLGRDRGRLLVCVDGVHGLGVENETVGSLGVDFLVSGCHKWLFGPRGTGLVWGRQTAWPSATPTIPAFSGGSPARDFTPGGFHSFEHRWALADAFRFHGRIGKRRVAVRIHALNRQLKDGLAAMPHVALLTPRAEALSAGIVVFSVDRLSPGAVIAALARRRIVATVTPYSPSHARLAPGLLNSPGEVDRVLAAVRSLR
jgi:isopenicillin-N epimerase